MSIQLHDMSPDAAGRMLTERFERKYYLTPEKIGLAYGLLRHSCLPDNGYYSEQINSLYFDTPDLDQHERSSSGDTKKDKIRIRWYGKIENLQGPQSIYIELKSKLAFASTKQRYKQQVPVENLLPENLLKGIVPESLLVQTLAGFGYFSLDKLVPVIQISYWRYRFSEIITGQRISLDCHIRSGMVLPGYGKGIKELELPGAVIEIKGQTMEIPESLYRTRILETDWTRFSKYSACLDSHQELPGSAGWLSPSGRLVWI